jgi:hypothetical protein
MQDIFTDMYADQKRNIQLKPFFLFFPSV